MIAAQAICDKSGFDFVELFGGQYCLSAEPQSRPEGWRQTETFAGWQLTHCPSLQRRDLVNGVGQQIGWLLGVVVNADGHCLGDESYTIDSASWSGVEAQLATLAGRFLAVVLTASGRRVYFDPVMDLPSVFNAKARCVASSPLLALHRPLEVNHRTDHRLIHKQGGNYGLQQTCDRDVLRGLSNHYLDLDSFSLHRHWPAPDLDFSPDPAPLDEIAARITTRFGQITGALMSSYDCLIPLSGGADSRTLAFSARDKIHLAKGCYAHRTNFNTELDCYVANQLAEALGTELHLIDAITDAPDRQTVKRLRWDFWYRTGYHAAPTPPELAASALVPKADFILRANILDMAIANQWPRDNRFDLGHAVSKLNIGSRAPEEDLTYWGPDYQNWAKTVPQNAQPALYEMAFLEQLLPNTLGARLLGYRGSTYLNPFNDRGLIRACMRVSPKDRKSGRLTQALHKACGAPDIPMIRQIKRDETLLAEAKARTAEMFG